MRIGIAGNGAIGNLLALKCETLSLDYSLLTRSGQPLNITASPYQNSKQHFSPKITLVQQAADFELLILPLKAYQIIPCIQSIKSTIQPSQHLVLLHNGMGTIEQVQNILPQQTIIAASTTYGAYKPNEHEVLETGIGQSHAGWIHQGKDPQNKLVESTLSALLPPCTWHSDIRQALWNKLAVNAVINPLTAINKIKNGELEQAQYSALIENICHETVAVMQASGFQCELSDVLANVYQVIRQTGTNYSSMYQDIYLKRQSEIDFINGYIVKTAEKLRMTVPLHRQLRDKIKALEA